MVILMNSLSSIELVGANRIQSEKKILVEPGSPRGPAGPVAPPGTVAPRGPAAPRRPVGPLGPVAPESPLRSEKPTSAPPSLVRHPYADEYLKKIQSQEQHRDTLVANKINNP